MISERIKQIRKEAGLTQAEFAERTLLSMNGVSQIERGLFTPSAKSIELICREFNVRREWLETGEGPVHLAGPDEEEAIFRRLQSMSNVSAAALRAVVRFYVSLGSDGIEVLDQLIRQALEKDPE